MTAISTLVEPLKRELAIPGTFAGLFPDTTDLQLIAALADGFAEAQLWGFFPDTALVFDEPNDEWDSTPDLSLAGGALVVIYTSMRFIRSQIRNLTTEERYKAGPVEFETKRAASTLKAELDYLQSRLDGLIANAKEKARMSAGMATVFDNYIARGGLATAVGGFYGHEYKG